MIMDEIRKYSSAQEEIARVKTERDTKIQGIRTSWWKRYVNYIWSENKNDVTYHRHHLKE